MTKKKCVSNKAHPPNENKKENKEERRDQIEYKFPYSFTR